ncbi:MAG: M3 family oligoendopeptidase [Clostridiales Family XIII bacterium]|jgi:M3 family oligoendopeptidase|nr:M3 family oligoendopeptidase [Clostridiales Family XIII bacterium]
MKFSEMTYERIDTEAESKQYFAFAEAIKSAESFEAADAAYLAYDRAVGHADTLFAIAGIRHLLDREDVFYRQENLFCGQADAELGSGRNAVAAAILDSPFRDAFAAKYGEILLVKLRNASDAQNPLIVEERKTENKLTNEYDDVLLEAKVPWEGRLLTQHEMSEHKFTADDGVRYRAWCASGETYLNCGAELDRIFDELVKTRTAAARKLGYENFIPLAYRRMQRDWFSRDDLPPFRAAVKECIVPLTVRLKRAQADRLGVAYPMNFADNTMTFRSGIPQPAGTQEDTFRSAVRAFRELSPETAEFIGFLTEHECFDVSQRAAKSSGGFVTFLPDFRAPFLFSHFSGEVTDVNSIMHEGGHAFAGYMSRNIVPAPLREPPLDTAEIHSQAMEFFLLPQAELFCGQDALKFRVEHLTDAFTMIPYGVMVDEFQHLLYERPEWSPEERHDAWRELMGEYTPWLRLGDIPFYGDGRHWQRQPHIYTDPFYYIDYVLSQIVALRFWAASRADFGDAWRRYLELVKQGGKKNFIELVEIAGFESPFAAETLKRIADSATAWLSGVDLSALK